MIDNDVHKDSTTVLDRERIIKLCSDANAIRRNEPRAALQLAEQALELAQPLEDALLKAECMFCIVRCFEVIGDHANALDVLGQVRDLFEEIGDIQGVHRVLNTIGNIYTKVGQAGKALKILQQSRKFRESVNDSRGLMSTLNLLGNVYKDLGDYQKAFDHYYGSLRYAEELDSSLDCGIAMNNIGNTYFRLEENSNALKFYQRSLAVRRSLGDKYGQAVTLGNIGNIYNLQGDCEKALSFQRQSLDLRQELDDQYGQTFVLSNIARIYVELEDYETALTYIDQALAVSHLSDNKRQRAQALIEKGRIQCLRGEFDEGLAHVRKALTHAEETGSMSTIMDAHSTLAGLYEDRRDFAKAYEHLKLFRTLKESEMTREKSKAVANLQVRYELESTEKEKEIYRLRNVDLERANYEILQQQETLQQQASAIESANQRLRDQNEALESLNREKNEFLGVVAHDLKNPLSSILMIGKLLRSDKLAYEEVQDHAGYLEELTQGMFELISDLLDINAIELGRVNINADNFELATITQSLLDGYRERARKKNITIHFNNAAPDSTIYADSNRTRQIIDNLISNAVKFSFNGKRIWTQIKASPPRPDLKDDSRRHTAFIRLEVRDEGPGIAADERHKLFQKFAKLSSRPTDGEHSSGLGLSIVKKLTEAMQGRVWCESIPGQGATFIVELPVRPAHVISSEQS